VSDQPEPIGPPGYQVDEDHDLYLELVAPNGVILQSFKCPAPLNQNAAAPIAVQVTLAHHDGCARTIQTVPIRPY
jgi:hypothetical protein